MTLDYIYASISDPTDCDQMQSDLNIVYSWAKSNNMFFNSKKFDYMSFSSHISSNKSSVYLDPNHNIIPPSKNALDLGIYRVLQQKTRP